MYVLFLQIYKDNRSTITSSHLLTTPITIILYHILNDIYTSSFKLETIAPLFLLKQRLKISPSKRIFCKLFF